MKKIYLIAVFIIIAALRLSAQQVDPLKQNITADVDNRGDAHYTFSTTYNTSQWDNFKTASGSNALDLLKRQMERSLPGYYLQGWEYKEDPPTHTWTLSFDALGEARIDDNGNWVIDLDQKKPDVTKISDVNYALTNTITSYGVIIQQIMRLNLPAGSKNVVQDKDAFGKAIFTYEMTPGGGAAHLLFIIAGVLLIAAAVVLYLKPNLLSFGKNRQVKPFTVVSSQQAPAAVAPISPEPPPANPNIEKQA